MVAKKAAFGITSCLSIEDIYFIKCKSALTFVVLMKVYRCQLFVRVTSSFRCASLGTLIV